GYCTLSLHDALPISSDMTDKDSSSAKAPTLPDTQRRGGWGTRKSRGEGGVVSFSSTYFLYTYLSARISQCLAGYIATTARTICRSEEHTSELQSPDQ